MRLLHMQLKLRRAFFGSPYVNPKHQEDIIDSLFS